MPRHHKGGGAPRRQGGGNGGSRDDHYAEAWATGHYNEGANEAGDDAPQTSGRFAIKLAMWDLGQCDRYRNTHKGFSWALICLSPMQLIMCRTTQ